VARVFLDLPWRDEKANTPWPSSEAAFKMPTEYSQTFNSGDRPAAGGTNIPTPVIEGPAASIRDATVTVPIVSEFDSSVYSVVIYVKDPKGLLLSYIPDDSSDRVITYQFAQPGELQPGIYTFWAALVDRATFVVGPASSSFTLEVPES
jgi:hypothetical protein